MEHFFCLIERAAVDEISRSGSAERVGSGTGDRTGDCIAPDGEQLQQGSRTFPEDDADPEVGPECGNKFGGHFPAHFSTADINNGRNHADLERGENREISERDRFSADGGAEGYAGIHKGGGGFAFDYRIRGAAGGFEAALGEKITNGGQVLDYRMAKTFRDLACQLFEFFEVEFHAIRAGSKGLRTWIGVVFMRLIFAFWGIKSKSKSKSKIKNR